jgi:hypothetical protein
VGLIGLGGGLRLVRRGRRSPREALRGWLDFCGLGDVVFRMLTISLTFRVQVPPASVAVKGTGLIPARHGHRSPREALQE